MHLVSLLAYISLLDLEIQLRTAKDFLVELDKKLQEDNEFLSPHLPHINSHLYNAVLACRAAECEQERTPEFKNKQFVAPGKKSEQQWRFTRQARHQVESVKERSYGKY